MQVFNPLWFKEDPVKLAIATEEVEDAVAIYDELLGYRPLLDKGLVMNTETYTPEFDGVIWSGLRSGDEAIVRAFTQADSAQTLRFQPFAEADEVEFQVPTEGKWFMLRRDGKQVLLSRP
jgi:hypothetical protein